MEEFQQRGEGRGSWVSTTDVQIQARKGPEMEKGPLIAEYRFDSFASTCAHVKIIKPLLFHRNSHASPHIHDCFPNQTILKAWHPATDPNSPAMTK